MGNHIKVRVGRLGRQGDGGHYKYFLPPGLSSASSRSSEAQ
jgi:hypothetical protein